MSVLKLDYRKVLKEDFHADYILRHEKLYYEIAQINNELLFFEKFGSISFSNTLIELSLIDEIMILNIIHRSMFAHLGLKFVRTAIDKHNDTYTLMNFKNDILKNLKEPKHKTIITEHLKGKFSNNKLLSDIRNARNEFIAHKNSVFVTSNSHNAEYFSFEELKSCIFEMNEIFKALTFDIKDTYVEAEYALDVRNSVLSVNEKHMDKLLLKILTSSSEISNGTYIGSRKLSSDTETLLKKFKVLK